MKNSKIFDEIATKYEKDRLESPLAQEELKLLRRYISRNCLILDAACGTGRHMLPLQKAGLRVIGFDISLGMLKRIRSGIRVKADIRRIPFRSTSFDVAYCLGDTMGIFLLQEISDIVKELKRVSRKGGVIIMTFGNKNNPAMFLPEIKQYLYSLFRQRFGYLEYSLYGKKFRHYNYSENEFREVMARERLKILDIERTGAKLILVCRK